MTPLWRDVAARLKASDTPTPDLDARLLVAHSCEIDPAKVLVLDKNEVSGEQKEILEKQILRRISGEPVSRIIGKRGFWNHDFIVSPATLDPRPDSETLIELTLKIIDHEKWNDTPIRILDLGTGSGCLLISLLDELPNAHGVGVDISEDALSIAERNAEVVGCADRAHFQCGNWFDGLTGTFDIVISNPPYIPNHELESLARDVRDFDPVLALDGGGDGLDAYRSIISSASVYAPDGWLIFECGKGQSDDVARLMSQSGFHASIPKLSTAKDLADVVRCVAGRAQFTVNDGSRS